MKYLSNDCNLTVHLLCTADTLLLAKYQKIVDWKTNLASLSFKYIILDTENCENH